MQAQLDPVKVSQAISHIEGRLRQVKRTMEELLFSLEAQDQVSYPDMISKFSSLARQWKSAKTHLIVPERVSMIPDTKLQNISEGRLISWNHEVIPVYLRTKLNPDVEEDERKIESERSRQTWEHLSKQIAAFNKHIESLSTRLSESSRQSNDRQRERPAFSTDETGWQS
uniref:Mediator of RNA polymerase II transcription subunit 8 n=1 Tax=Ditylenchus dipsaci TaxID=166011 RepID=A0A915D225_9BILA